MFAFPQKVLFKHCDPAGIVFYPRYFEMINDCIEAFFEEIGVPFHDLHRSHGVPTAQIETRFLNPSRHGDRLLLRLAVTRIGGASLGLAITARAGEEVRFETTSTLVHVDGDGRPTPWPADLRDALAPYLEETP